jgi:hypothetical protein
VRLEGIGQLKNPMTSGIETRNIPACKMVPRPATLQRAHRKVLLHGANTLRVLCHIQLTLTMFPLEQNRFM